MIRNDVVPQKLLFEAVVSSLKHARVPLHYKTLTNIAITSLGLDKRALNMHKVIEDVREQLLDAGRLGTFYVPRPHCLGALREWFRCPQEMLFHLDRVHINGSAKSGVLGAYEALMRAPFMIDKTISGDVMNRNMARAKGLVLEQHVFGWMLETWPEFVLPAENEGQYHRPCSHDFRLEVNGQIIKVDVAGKSYLTQMYGSPRFGKQTTDLHLLCCIERDDVFLEGVQRGTEFGEHVMPVQATSPMKFIVWLNCLQAGLPYALLSDVARKGQAA